MHPWSDSLLIGEITIATVYHLADQEDAGWRTNYKPSPTPPLPNTLWAQPIAKN